MRMQKERKREKGRDRGKESLGSRQNMLGMTVEIFVLLKLIE